MKKECSTCGKVINNKPRMEIFTIDSGIWRNFCLDCIILGYRNLKKLKNPNQDQVDLMVKFGNFLKSHSKKAKES